MGRNRMKVEQDVYDIITLDLWDTVIRRKCHPDEIKDKTSDYLLINYYEHVAQKFRDINILTQYRVDCEKEIGEKTKEAGFDDEYEIHEVLRSLIKNVMPQYEDWYGLADELYEFELHTELMNAYLDPDIVELVESIPHKQLAYLSDFYAGREFIDVILSHIECPLYFDKRYISCECGFNKRSGRLFEYVENDLGIEAGKQLHIGDNLYSDVEIPKEKKIAVIHYLPENEHTARIQKERNFIKNKSEIPKSYQSGKLKSKGDISVFFYGFLHWILESCLQEGIEEIYFFTREGEFFKRVYDEIVKNEYSCVNTPKADLLEVSRLSTFCPSLRKINLNEMMRIWNQYSVQSMEALFKSLGMEREDVSSFLKKFDIPWKEIITYPWQDNRIIALFNDPEFLLMFEKQRNYKKELLLRYLLKKGINIDDQKHIAIVDIGWRGTIQDNLSYLLPNHMIKGYYVGLIPFLNEQPVNTIKRGYLNGYKNIDFLLKYVMPFEMISNSPNGSTVEYKSVNNNVYAVRKKEKEEDQVYYQYVEKIQRNVLDDISKIGGRLADRKYIANNIRAIAYNKLNNYILYPPRDVTCAYFSLKHNEEFGVGEYVDKTTLFRLDLFIKACFGRKNRSRLAQFLRNTTWPQGYLTKYHMTPLVKLYNKRYCE